jgi:transposase-like protein
MDKRRRIFSEEFRKEIVSKVDRGVISISVACREYGMSKTTLYQWLYRYSSKYVKEVRMVIEKVSEENQRKELEVKVRELERLLGQKQVEIEYLKKIIDIGSQEIGYDLKKKSNPNFELVSNSY